MRTIRILEAAAEAAAWYEQERSGLGAKFQEAVDAALDLLEQEMVPLTFVPGRLGNGERGVSC
jgi:hypothetical protein